MLMERKTLFERMRSTLRSSAPTSEVDQLRRPGAVKRPEEVPVRDLNR